MIHHLHSQLRKALIVGIERVLWPDSWSEAVSLAVGSAEEELKADGNFLVFNSSEGRTWRMGTISVPTAW